jgi:hypothetical protein
MVALLLIAMMYFLGVYSERTGFVEQVLDPGIKRITHPVLNAFRGKPPVVPQLRIVVSEEDLDSLRAVREHALLEGWLGQEGNPRFACVVEADGVRMTGRLNLKEGPSDRLRDRHWPYHVRLDDGRTVQDMQGFDLQPVRDGRSLHAWMFSQALVHLGLPSFLHAFTDVRLNGRDQGLYVMEGRLDTTALRRWGRGSGPVMRFDDGLLESTRKAGSQRHFQSDPGPQGDWMAAPILALRMQQVMDDPTSAQRFRQAMQTMELFRAGRLPATAVMDGERLAQLLALGDVLGAQGTTSWWNLRFLADSLSGRLLALPQRYIAGEPISTLQVLRSPEPIRFPALGSDFHQRVFGDSLLYMDYMAYLDTFSAPGWVEDLLLGMAPALSAQERIVGGEIPTAGLDRTILEHCRTVVRQNLQPRDLMLAYTQTQQGPRRRIAMANVHALPVVVHGHVIKGDTIPWAKPLILWPRERDRPLTYTHTTIDLAASPDGTPELLAGILGLPATRSIPVRTWSTISAN